MNKTIIFLVVIIFMVFPNCSAMNSQFPLTAEDLAKLAKDAKPLKQWRLDQVECRVTPRYTLFNPQGQRMQISSCPIESKDLPKEAIDTNGQLKSDWKIEFSNIEEIIFTEDKET